MNIFDKLYEAAADSGRQNDFHCWRCREMSLQIVTLIGDYVCNLCIRCRNSFDEYVRENPAKVKLQEIEIRMSQIKARTTYDGLDRTAEFCEIMDEYRRTRIELFNIGKEWVHAAAVDAAEKG